MICSMTSSGSCDIPQRVSTVMTNNKHCWLRQTQKKRISITTTKEMRLVSLYHDKIKKKINTN